MTYLTLLLRLHKVQGMKGGCGTFSLFLSFFLFLEDGKESEVLAVPQMCHMGGGRELQEGNQQLRKKKRQL